MTPFGIKIKQLRKERNLTLKDQANFFKISQSYVSSLENGNRGKPSTIYVDQICVWLNLIWDEAEELKYLANFSQPKVTISTKNLSSEATFFANLISQNIDRLTNDHLLKLRKEINKFLEIDEKVFQKKSEE